LAALWAGLVFSLSQSSFAALLVGLAVLAAVRWRARPVITAAAAALAILAIVVFAIPGSVHLQGHSAKSPNRATRRRVDPMRLRRDEEPGARLLGRMVVAAAFAALVFHTLLYADFLEDPIAWTLLGIGIALRRGPPRARGTRPERTPGAAAEAVPSS